MRQSVDSLVVEILGQAQRFLLGVLRDFPLLSLDVTRVLGLHLDLQPDLLAQLVVQVVERLVTADEFDDFGMAEFGAFLE